MKEGGGIKHAQGVGHAGYQQYGSMWILHLHGAYSLM